MAEWVLKYADPSGAVHQQVVEAPSEREVRDRFAQRGMLVYSVRPRGWLSAFGLGGRRPKKIHLERFLIFNQQFVTLIKAGLPILKSLELLADRLTDPKLSQHIQQVRDEVRKGTSISEAFRKQGIFPPIYVTSVMAGEKSGSLAEVIERYITYQQMALAVKKKITLSLIYPSFLVLLVICLVVFLVAYVVPSFSDLYRSMDAELPAMTQFLIAIGTSARNYVFVGFGALVVALVGFRIWAQRESAQHMLDRWKLRTPVAGEIWIKYQVAQLSRVLSTLLVGGIPLVQALETAGEALGATLVRDSIRSTARLVREGKPLSRALQQAGIFPTLAIDMTEVGESTGALPAMLRSVAEFFEDDVNTRMTATLSLIEPVIMIFMGAFVAFVLVALYLPIFSLAESFGG
jgi:type IV pilus assembly protein PilC